MDREGRNSPPFNQSPTCFITNTQPEANREPSSRQLRVKPRPYQQGGLDSLCGVYVLMNAVRYLGPRRHLRHYEVLIENVLTHLNNRKKGLSTTARLAGGGTYLQEIASVLKTIICPRYGIRRAKPYHQDPDTTLDHFLSHCQDFLGKSGGIILIGIDGTYDHWTLIREVTDKRVLLYDSNQLQYFRRAHCCLPNDPRLTTHILLPTHTYFLWLG